MDKEKIKAQILEAGATEEQIAKIDFDKVEDIIDNAHSIDSLCATLKSNYPDFNEAVFRDSLEKKAEESEEAQALSEKDLESVAGGSAGNWIKENKELVIGLSLLALCVPVGIYLYRRGKVAGQAKAEEVYQAGVKEGTEEMTKAIPKIRFNRIANEFKKS